ncbi:NAD(P)-dependent oxidoreductase [uncultured Pseudoteredinibacter sp.]|uniref:NAD-dependent epimerase/dehydratase family protein n=1 Tax=uncultured Pseudoteredinibacter sp. TaxID=1641701 RepID=UPI00262F40FB|nr:NAD(P)-dependent oxidoreductase [uncultured Pseudoteredinibacter sp.]
MKIFLTGASGFVGKAALQMLVKEGHEVVAMSRRAESDQLIESLGGTPKRCDLESIDAEHIAGCDTVIHSAAYVEQWGPKDAWHKANVIGTENMLAAAKQAGVKRFIHIGTEAGLVHGQDLHHADESYPLAPDSPYPYCASKAQAEQRVMAANSEQMPCLVIRPRFIWGPGDQTLLPAIEKMAKQNAWVWINHGQAMTSSTHIDNLIHAIKLALHKGEGGEAYFVLDDGDHSLRDMIEGMAASKQLQLGNKNLPLWLASALGAICENSWRWLNLSGEPPLNNYTVMVMSRNCTLKDDKARSELGYQPVISWDEGMANL